MPVNIPVFVHGMKHGPCPPPLRALHQIYRRRFKAGVRHLSRCRDVYPIRHPRMIPMHRADSLKFHDNVAPPAVLKIHLCENKFMRKLWSGKMCQDICDRFEIYGLVGRGSTAAIYAAREKNDPKKQYIIKLRATEYRKAWVGHDNPPFAEYMELGSKEWRYIPAEAIYLQLLSQCPRFPKLDSVYVHKELTLIAMSAEAVTRHREREVLTTHTPFAHYFPSYTGEELVNGKTPRLTEIQVCKIASHLLQAMTYLMDLNILHDDLSHRNYLVDENLNVTLIDLGLIHASLTKEGWFVSSWAGLLASEFLISPQVALRMRSGVTPTHIRDTAYIRYDHDIRNENIWRFGVLMYDLLHGYAPWEPPNWEHDVGALRHFASVEMTEKRDAYLRQRRWRMINEELPIDERLSQDCVDVLKALLAKEEAKRPTLRDVATFPWFQGQWMNHPEKKFQRPQFLDRQSPSLGHTRYYEGDSESEFGSGAESESVSSMGSV